LSATVAADDCGYSACHGGDPIPGSETSRTVETACVPGRPALKGKLKARHSVRISGKLTPPPSIGSTLTVNYQRLVSRRYRATGSTKLRVAAGTATYALRHKFAKRGRWRVRVVHVKLNGAQSRSPWRAFRIR
jgi:hypothetical protein